MVTATEWFKKAEEKRSKSTTKFKAVSRRAWDYIDQNQEATPAETNNSSQQKWEQKWEQSGNEIGNNSEQKWEQSGNEIGSNREQKWEQSGNGDRNECRNENRTKIAIKKLSSQENVILNDLSAQKKLLTLTGHQKQIMKQITCHLKSKIGEGYTVDILPNVLAIKINATLAVTRMTLKRLVSKSLLIRLIGERGRNGCCKFNIPENITKICFTIFHDAPCDINYIGNEIGNNNKNNDPYSSSSILKTTTTMMPENWEQIDFSSLVHIGFSRTQLLQLHSKQLNIPEVIQESIHHFAYGLENNPKFKTYTEPLNVLIGVLRKGQQWYEPSYVSPKELSLRKLLDDKRKKKEQIDAMVNELFELEFPDWKRKLTEKEMIEIVPEDIRKTNLSAAIQATLRNYYKEKILLPRIENKIS